MFLAAVAPGAAVGTAPQTVRHWSPVFRGALTLVTERIHGLLLGHIGGMGAGSVDHPGQCAVVIQQRTRAQMVLVEGLAVVVLHKERGLIRLDEGFLVDVGIGIMDESAGLNVAVGVDMEVATSAGDAALGRSGR